MFQTGESRMERQVLLTSTTGLVGADLTPAYRSSHLNLSSATSSFLSPIVACHLCLTT